MLEMFLQLFQLLLCSLVALLLSFQQVNAIIKPTNLPTMCSQEIQGLGNQTQDTGSSTRVGRQNSEERDLRITKDRHKNPAPSKKVGTLTVLRSVSSQDSTMCVGSSFLRCSHQTSQYSVDHQLCFNFVLTAFIHQCKYSLVRSSLL